MRKFRVAAVLTVVAVLAGAWRLGILSQLQHPEQARASIAAMGPWAWVAFVLAYTVLQPFGVPGTVFILVAPLLWPWPVAFALSMVGTMAASVVGFSFARFVARDFVAARIPARIKKYDEALEKRAFATVLVLRLIFWMPPWLHFFFGVSRVSFATHFWASLLGYVPSLLATAYFGERFFAWMRTAPPSAWAGVAGLLAAAAGVAWVVARRKKRPEGEGAP
ncbi:MAG: VTT domain-containing protein [Polyangiales bacterium]